MTHRRSLFVAALCMMAFTAICFAQMPVNFATVVTKGGPTPYNVYAIDVNNDGIPDIVQDSAQPPHVLTVSISNGDGTFRPPVSYSLPLTFFGPTPLTSGDFNGDGKIDLLVPVSGTNTVLVYFGNGDGTFQAPKTFTIPLPAGQTLSSGQVATADFNHDGKLDLVTTTSRTTSKLLCIFPGDGAGGFGAPHSIAIIPSNAAIVNLVLGDFDADNNPDVAIASSTNCSDGAICSTTVNVLFTDGNFGAHSTNPYNSTGAFNLASGDLNSDGRTDLFGIDSATGKLAVFYGQTDRTFTSYFSTLPSGGFGGFPSGGAPPIAMADFNDDWQMDLVTFGFNSVLGHTEMYLVYFLATGTPGQFTTQEIPLGSYDSGTNVVVGDFNGDRKPDVVVNQSNEEGGPPNNSPSYLIAAINATSGSTWSNCNYPHAGEGLALCGPIVISGPVVSFDAAATSFGQLRKMEVWVDGSKIGERDMTWGHNAFLNWATVLGGGTHSATLFSADTDNRLQKLDFSFTIGTGPCNIPAALGISVCTPAGGSTVSSPVLVEAAANTSLPTYQFEVWVDGVKKYTAFNTSYLNTSILLNPGNHRFDFYAENGNLTKWEKTVYATTGK